MNNLKFFAETYFPHYLTAGSSPMHKTLLGTYQNMIENTEQTGKGQKYAAAAPRGHAKSTITSLIFPLWCVMGERRKFIALLSDTTEQAVEFLEFIKAELEVNERLLEDFPEATGSTSSWRQDNLVTQNGIRIKCWGKRKRIRGARHRNRRPDLVICDDLEGDEHVDSPKQREKDRNWFSRALLKAGGPYTVYIVVGTLLHYDSLLSQLLKRPGWTGKIWQAVMKWSQSNLWEQWETLYVTQGEDAASAFYEKNKSAMLKNTKVLWPEMEDYEYLMKMRVSDGPACFDSEKQNQPVHPEDCLFNEEWFTYVSEDSIQHRMEHNLYVQRVCAVDPSLGKSARRGDPSAILIGGVQADGRIDVLEADITRRAPDKILEDIFNWHQKYNFTSVGIEETQFQELFKDLVLKESLRRKVYLPVEGLRPVSDKTLRITRMQPHIKNGVLRFRKRHITLLEQLRYFPKAEHDDGPDALEMLFGLISNNSHGPRIRSFA